MAESESSEALRLKNTQPQQGKQEEGEDDKENDDDEEEEEEAEQEQEDDEEDEQQEEKKDGEEGIRDIHPRESKLGESLSSGRSDNAVLRESKGETLAHPSAPEPLVNDQCEGLKESCTTRTQSIGGADLKEQIGTPKQEYAVTEALPAAEALRCYSDNQVPVPPTILSEVSPASGAQSFSSDPSSAVPEQRLPSPKASSMLPQDVENKIPSGRKTLSAISVMKTSAADGYNWRKYGQKQVKSPTGSRSYYRCTYSECTAKKIECSDDLGRIIEVVYKSQHIHDPPQKFNPSRERKFAAPVEPALRNNGLEQPTRVLVDSDHFPSSKEPVLEMPLTSERKVQKLRDSDDNGEIMVKEGQAHVPDPKRSKKSELADSDSLVKPSKKPKLVVHAMGDVGISGDGYRWRKYGQKMVKGNPHPRNYYRCTSAGCPVRKHIETAVDDNDALIITYKGVHDHDMPVPKKRHGPPSGPLVAAAAPASMNNMQCNKTDTRQNQMLSSQCSLDREGEISGEAMDLGGEKAMESARTLLSIGFEIKPC